MRIYLVELWLMCRSCIFVSNLQSSKKIPGKATSILASNDQNGKFCPSNRLTKEELMEIAKDEAKGYQVKYEVNEDKNKLMLR